jgi:hypothetical protein
MDRVERLVPGVDWGCCDYQKKSKAEGVGNDCPHRRGTFGVADYDGLHGHLISDEEIEPKMTEVIPFEQGQDSGTILLPNIITSDLRKMNRGQQKEVKRLVLRWAIV